MKKIGVIAFYLLFILASCSKGEADSSAFSLDKQIYGRWYNNEETFQDIFLVRSTRYGTFDKGYILYEDGTITERSESGVCVDGGCIMENYNGTYAIEGDNLIRINIVNLKGKVSYLLKFTIHDLNYIQATKL
jgi:hypothetical protein